MHITVNEEEINSIIYFNNFTMSTVKITKSDFTEKVNQGWKREQLQEHYGIKSSDVTAILKQLGLKIRKFHKPRFELVDDEVETIDHTVSSQDVENNPDAGLTEGEDIQITEVQKEETKAPRKRRTKAEIEADKAAKEEAEAVEIQEDTETSTVEDSNIGEATVVEESPIAEEASEEVDVLKATEDVQTSFNIPNGAGTPSNVGSEDAFNAQPTDDVQEENPFIKAWGNQQ